MNDELKIVENGLAAAQDEAYKSGTMQCIDSREVAKIMEKQHKNLLADITRYSKELNQLNFQPVEFFIKSTYVDAKGEKRLCYLVTKKGCEFIAHKLTGIKGTKFTATYINRFHQMEGALEGQIAPIAIQQFMEHQQNLMEELVKMNHAISDRLIALESKKEELLGVTIGSGSKPFTVEEDENARRKKILNKAVTQMAKAYGWTKSFALHRLYKTLEEVLYISMDDYVDCYKEEIQADACAIDAVVASDRLYATALRLCNNTINKMSVAVQS